MNIVREYSKQDFDQLKKLVIASNLYQKQELEKASIDVSQVQSETSKMFTHNLDNPHRRYFVAEQQSQIIGFSLAEVSTLYHGKGSIVDLYVAPEYRQQGVGKGLLEAALAWLKNQDVYSVNLAVHNSNLKAIDLYTSLGFEEEPDEYRYLVKKLEEYE